MRENAGLNGFHKKLRMFGRLCLVFAREIQLIKYFILILFFITTPFAQNQQTIAVFDFVTQPPVSSQKGKDVSETLQKQFIVNGNYLVLEKWMIDTVLFYEGYGQNRSCDDLKCYLSIGNMLAVNKIISGSILKRGKNIEISAFLIDVESRKVENSSTVTIPSGKKQIPESDITVLFQKIINNSGNYEKKESDTQKTVIVANTVDPATKDNLRKKSIFRRKGFWITT
jgi:TolB-like protein